MSIYRKDETGATRKIAGHLVQRFNDRIFTTVHSVSGGNDYYDIADNQPGSNGLLWPTNRFITDLSDFTEFQLMIFTPNTTENVYIRFAGRTLRLHNWPIPPATEGRSIEPGDMQGRISVYTLQASVPSGIGYGAIYLDSVGDYNRLENRPQINSITLAGNNTGRHFLVPDILLDDLDDPMIEQVATRFHDSIVETARDVNIVINEPVDINRDNIDIMEYGQLDHQIVLRSDETPLWRQGNNYHMLATRDFVRQSAAADRYQGQFDWALLTWDPTMITTDYEIGKRAIAIDTRYYYTITAIDLTDPDNPVATWEQSAEPVEVEMGFYWKIPNFVFAGRPGQITWNENTSQFDVFYTDTMAADEDTIVTDINTRTISVRRTPYHLTIGYGLTHDATEPVAATVEEFDGSEYTTFLIRPSVDAFNRLTIGSDGLPYVGVEQIILDDGDILDEHLDMVIDDGYVVAS